MAIVPIQIARVSNLLSSSISDQSITATQAQLLNVQNELTTGKQITQPSDNPADAALILALNKSLSQQTGYTNNVTAATSQLGAVDSSLTNLNNLLLQAQQIASKDAGSAATATQRQGDAQVVTSLLTEVQSLANTKSNGVYVYGGDNGNQPPYVGANGGIQFVGAPNVLQTQVDEGVLAPTSISGPSVFGGISARINGSTNLNPTVTPQTQLADLNGATASGIDRSTIQLGNGTNTANIDLSQAQTLGDVVNDINAAGVGGITATLSNNGIILNGAPTDNISVTDIDGTGAADLGIATAGAGVGNPLTGAPLDPKITPLTPLSTLEGGAGLDSSGIIISNGITTKTLTFPAGGDIQSILNSINGAGVGAQATINSTGSGINVQSTTQGTTLTIGENGGLTATQLGIRSFSPTSPLSELNNGNGVGTAPNGGTADFTITNTAGTAFSVSVTGAVTVQDVINDINTASAAAAGGAGANVTASFATTGNGIVLTDSSGGNTSKFTVASVGGSSAAADLGLSTAASGNTITGTDVNGIQASGIFGDLSALATALTNNDLNGINAAAEKIQTDTTAASAAQGLAGAQSQALQNRTAELSSQNVATQQLLSSVQDVNMTSAISEFQTLQTALQAALLTTAQSQQLSLLNFLS